MIPPDLTKIFPLPVLQFWAAMERTVVLFSAGFLAGQLLSRWLSR